MRGRRAQSRGCGVASITGSWPSARVRAGRPGLRRGVVGAAGPICGGLFRLFSEDINGFRYVSVRPIMQSYRTCNPCDGRGGFRARSWPKAPRRAIVRHARAPRFVRTRGSLTASAAAFPAWARAKFAGNRGRSRLSRRRRARPARCHRARKPALGRRLAPAPRARRRRRQRRPRRAQRRRAGAARRAPLTRPAPIPARRDAGCGPGAR